MEEVYERTGPTLEVDLTRFSASIRKQTGSGPIITLIKELIDAATIVSDLKLAKEALRLSRLKLEDVGSFDSREAPFAAALALSAFYDLAIIRYARAVHSGGSRKPFKLRKELSKELQTLHDAVMFQRDKFIAHSTSEKIGGVTTRQTVVWYVVPNTAGTLIRTRTPEYQMRKMDAGELSPLFDIALSKARDERTRRNDALVKVLFKLPSESPIWPIFEASKFDAEGFFVLAQHVKRYRSQGFVKQDGVNIDLFFDTEEPSAPPSP